MRLITKSDRGSRRIAAVGMYDGVHRGHRFLIDYLRLEARSRGLIPSVVTFSRHPLSLVRPLGTPPLLSHSRSVWSVSARPELMMSCS